jgi:hypothetical protein
MHPHRLSLPLFALVLCACSNPSGSAPAASAAITDQPLQGQLDGKPWQADHAATEEGGWILRSEDCATEPCDRDEPEIVLDWDIASAGEGELGLAQNRVLYLMGVDQGGFVTEGRYRAEVQPDGSVRIGLNFQRDDNTFADGYVTYRPQE